MQSNKDKPYALSLDIGGSHVSSALISLESKEILKESLKRQHTEADASAKTFIDTWAKTAQESLEAVTYARVSQVGIAMPAPFDYKKGVSKLEHKFSSLFNQNVHDLLKEAWQGQLDCPIRYAHDADLFALGEWWAGAAQGSSRVMAVTLGTGLGAGFIQDGQILTDDLSIPPAGELWNVVYKDGIAEDYVSGSALVKHFAALSAQQLSGKAIAELAYQGDKQAKDCFEFMGENLAAILQPYVDSFAPDCVVIGGNIARAVGLFSKSLEKLGVPVKQSHYFEKAGLLGAAVLD